MSRRSKSYELTPLSSCDSLAVVNSDQQQPNTSWYYNFSETAPDEEKWNNRFDIEHFYVGRKEENFRRNQLTYSDTNRNPLVAKRRYCCLCWCCCCSCGLPSLTSESRKVAAMDSRYNPKPSKEDVIEWSRSFEKLLNNKVGLKIFHGFLKKEYAEENLLFWLSVERLKKERDPTAFKNMAQTIYNDYVSTESPKEVSIDHKTRQNIDVEMTNPSESIFDSAQKHVYYVMFQDCYPRFLMSNTYKALIMDD